MYPQHERTIRRLKETFEADPRYLCIIVGGSVAKGWAREDSDVDFMAISTDAHHAEANANKNLPILRFDLTDYEGGYVDGKTIPLQFLRDVADRGSEPARSAFLGAQVLFDRTGEVDDLIRRILVYPTEGLEDRIRSFYSQVKVWNWYVGEAAKRNDPYLMYRSVSEISLFAMRSVLAMNQRFYPYHKWVTRMLEETPNKPEGLIEKIHAMIGAPSVDSANAVVACLDEWRPWGVEWNEIIQRFLEDSEWNWMNGPAPLGDR